MGFGVEGIRVEDLFNALLVLCVLLVHRRDESIEGACIIGPRSHVRSLVSDSGLRVLRSLPAGSIRPAGRSRLLGDGGRFYCIHRAERLSELLGALSKARLAPKTARFIHSKPEEKARYVLLCAQKNAGEGMEIAPPLIVCTHAQTPEAILAPKQVPADEQARGAELGAAFAAGLAMGAF